MRLQLLVDDGCYLDLDLRLQIRRRLLLLLLLLLQIPLVDTATASANSCYLLLPPQCATPKHPKLKPPPCRAMRPSRTTNDSGGLGYARVPKRALAPSRHNAAAMAPRLGWRASYMAEAATPNPTTSSLAEAENCEPAALYLRLCCCVA